MVAEGVEEAAVDPEGAGGIAVETTEAVEGAQTKKAAMHWKSNTVWECFGCCWKVAEDRGWRMEVMHMGDVWWWQQKIEVNRTRGELLQKRRGQVSQHRSINDSIDDSL